MMSGSSCRAVLEQIQQHFMSLLDAETCRLYIHTASLKGAYEDGRFDSCNRSILTEGRSVAHVFKNRKTLKHLIVSSDMNDKLKQSIDPVRLTQIQSYLAIPLIVNGRIVAVAELFNLRRHSHLIENLLQETWENPFIVFCGVVARVVESVQEYCSTTQVPGLQTQ